MILSAIQNGLTCFRLDDSPEVETFMSQHHSGNLTGTEEAEVFVFATSFAQQRLWFLDQLAPGNPFYNDGYASDRALGCQLF